MRGTYRLPSTGASIHKAEKSHTSDLKQSRKPRGWAFTASNRFEILRRQRSHEIWSQDVIPVWDLPDAWWLQKYISQNLCFNNVTGWFWLHQFTHLQSPTLATWSVPCEAGRKSLVAQETFSLQGVIPASLVTGYPRSKIFLPGWNQVLSCMRRENCNNMIKCAAVTFQCASTPVKTTAISYRN